MNTFRHSGKLGDIIYCLPAMRDMGGGALYIDHRASHFEKPPLGETAALMIIELLRAQSYVQKAELYQGQAIAYDFDRFRDKATRIHALNCIRSQADDLAGALFGPAVKDLRRCMIPVLPVDLPQLHWECVGLPGRADVSRPWITGIHPKPLADIVVCKTARHPGSFDWQALKPYRDRCVFLGFESEWKEFRDDCFPVEFHRVASLLEFAQILAGAKLFVGNQSFGLALADAMLIPRAAQLWDASPNSMPPVNAHRTLSAEIVDFYIDL
jgi:hypothetical protein